MTFGKVDIVVNNAGIQHVAPIDEQPDDRWDAVIAINLSSAFHLVKAVLPGMKARGWGRVDWSRRRSRRLMWPPSTA